MSYIQLVKKKTYLFCFFFPLIDSNSELSNVELKQRLHDTLEVSTLANIKILMWTQPTGILSNTKIVWKAILAFQILSVSHSVKLVTFNWPPLFLIFLISQESYVCKHALQLAFHPESFTTSLICSWRKELQTSLHLSFLCVAWNKLT